MKKIISIILAIIAAVTYFVFLHYYSPTRTESFGRDFPLGQPDGPVVTIHGIDWTEAVNWNFKDGHYPTEWRWGDWELVDGYLHGRDPEGLFAVYFTPYTHGGDVLLETKVQFLEPGTKRDVEAQLLTRDTEDLNFESGMALFANTQDIHLRHMARKNNLIQDVVKSDELIEYGRWYVMQFVIYNKQIRGYLDGELVDSRAARVLTDLPVGMYQEPHLAVKSGSAMFEYIKIYFAAQSSRP